MTTFVVESPARRLRRELGLPEKTTSRLRVSDWLKFNCGDRVCRIDDPRHVGRVNAIFSGTTARVRWLDTGWIEDLHVNELTKHKATYK